MTVAGADGQGCDRGDRGPKPETQTGGDAASAPDHDAIITGLTSVLVKAVRALAKAGEPEEASRLSAKAWWALQQDYDRQAERINGTMHYLARLETDRKTAQQLLEGTHRE